MLDATTEEFISTKENVLSARKEELRVLLTGQVRAIFSLLTGVLLQHTNHILNPSTATDQTIHIIRSSVNCLVHMFAWAPLSECFVPDLLTALFRVIQVSESNHSDLAVSALGAVHEMITKNCVPKEFEEFLLAVFRELCAVLHRLNVHSGEYDADDMLYEKLGQCLHAFLSHHLRRIEQHGSFPVGDFLNLLFIFTSKQNSQSGLTSVLEAWEVFVDNVTIHAQRMESSMETQQYLNTYKAGLLCLVNELLQRMQFSSEKGSFLFSIDDSGTVAASGELENSYDLELEGEETELKIFLKRCVNLVEKIGELFPKETLQIVVPIFQSHREKFMQLASISPDLIRQGGSYMMQVLNPIKDMGTIVRLLGGFPCRYMGSVSSAGAIVQHPPERLMMASELLKMFLETLSYANTHRLYLLCPECGETQAKILITLRALVPLLAKCFALANSIKPVDAMVSANSSPLHESFGVDGMGSATLPTVVTDLAVFVGVLLDTACATLLPEVPVSVLASTADLICSVTSTFDSESLKLISSLNLLQAQAHRICAPLPLNIQKKIYSAIAQIIFAPLSVNRGADQNSCHENFVNLVQPLLVEFHELHRLPGFLEQKLYLKEEIVYTVRRTVAAFTALVTSIKGRNVHAKRIVSEAFKNLLSGVHSLLLLYMNNRNDIVEELLDLLLKILDELRREFGNAIVTTVKGFLGHEIMKSSVLVQIKVLELLNTLLQETSFTTAATVLNFRRLSMDGEQVPPGHVDVPSVLSDIIGLCLSDFSFMANNDSTQNDLGDMNRSSDSASDLKTAYFTLLGTILLHHWNYFFERTSGGLTVSPHWKAQELKPKTADALFQIFEIIYRSFSQQDLTTFKQNLSLLQSLQEKRWLYEQEPFVQRFQDPFVVTFLRSLVEKSHDLLRDEIINTVYDIVKLDFDRFFTKMLPNFLDSCSGLSYRQKEILLTQFSPDRDMPSFSRNANKLINDWNYYISMNRNLL
eukprot:GILJ01012472.1.p1 GENE.GILJ01012472.1~~GILJ01012472.1.p1  ORF type:complete len:1137 (-),score=202.40 GILJ01012472.1:110-3052(-)